MARLRQDDGSALTGVGPGTGGIPARILDRVRAIARAWPEVTEEEAWVGVRWSVRGKTFAHLLRVDGGKPPAYARAAATDGPAVVLTCRVSAELDDALRTAGPPFFHAPWGTRWGTQVIGVVLGAKVDWPQLEMLVGESWRAVAPRRLAQAAASGAGTRRRDRQT